MGSRMAPWWVALALAASANAQQSIQFAESVQLAPRAGVTQFDAYGRRFSLALTDNERVLRKLNVQQKGALSGYRLLRGSLAGAPGSWVRLTETPTGVEGAIWDGHEFYAVTRYENIAPYLTTPMSASAGQTVVYRLSDSRNALPRDFCGLSAETAESAEPTALDQYHALVAELGGGVVGASITRQIEISLIADTAFQQAEADPTAAMLARLNIVEGIFAEQVGLLILATDVRLMPSNADPFTSTKGSTLLEQLGSYRSATAAVRARGLAHLMTGKDLDGTTAGIAYVRTVCDRERGVSVSQRAYGTTLSALVMAHELGHNLGASHDGEPGTPCPDTEKGFIMSPSVSGYSTFSQCSIDTMAPVIAAASCVTPAQYADVLVTAGVDAVAGEGGVPFALPFTVRSAGNEAAQGTEVTITLPANAAFGIDSASSTLGVCSVSGLTATCALGDLPVDATAQVVVNARSSVAATFGAQARVTASNDRLTSNNNDQITVSLRSGVDARLQLSASAAEAPVGSAIEVYADLASLRAMSVRNASVSLNLNQPISGASIAGGNCTVNASSVVCAVAEIAPGTTRRLTVSALAQTAGPLFASASVGAAGDGDLTNNNASASGWVQAERDVELTTPLTVLDLGVGALADIPFTLRSRGPQATGDVVVNFTLPFTLVVDGVDAAGGTCSQPAAHLLRCDLGAVAPGATRTLNLRVSAAGPLTGQISAVAVAADDGYPGNNSTGLHVRVDHLVDLAVVLASGGSGIEDNRIDGQVTLRSNGRQTVTGATLDVDLHVAGVLKSVSVHDGAACTLLGDTRARCALPSLARNAQAFIDYSAEFAEPGDYDVKFTVSAAGDSAPANDALTRAVLVRPYLDAAVIGSLAMDGLYGSQSRVKTFTVLTDRRGLATLRFQAAHAPPALRVEAISASGGDCRVDDDLGGICDFTDLPAHASVPVSVTYRAAEGAAVVNPVVRVSTPGDVVGGNNSVTAAVETFGSTDLELRVGAALSGPSATTLTFPLIELVNGANRAITPRVDITLPPQVTVVDVSATDGMCSGTTSLRCDFNTLEAAARGSISLSVRASAGGSFVANVRVTTANDNNPANDARDVTLDIAAPPVATQSEPSTGAGKGGGGRLEWLALLFLALVKWGKWGHSPFPGNGVNPRHRESPNEVEA
jgi:hypothetical protein